MMNSNTPVFWTKFYQEVGDLYTDVSALSDSLISSMIKKMHSLLLQYPFKQYSLEAVPVEVSQEGVDSKTATAAYSWQSNKIVVSPAKLRIPNADLYAVCAVLAHEMIHQLQFRDAEADVKKAFADWKKNHDMQSYQKLLHLGFFKDVSTKLMNDFYLCTCTDFKHGTLALKSDFFKTVKLYADISRKKGKKTMDEAELNEQQMTKDQIEEFKKRLHEGEVKFKFTKKSNGEMRHARGTMKKDLLPEPPAGKKYDDDKLKNSSHKLPADSIFFYDLENEGFRSFKSDRFQGYED